MPVTDNRQDMTRAYLTMIPILCTLFPCVPGDLNICPKDACDALTVKERSCLVSSTVGSCSLDSFRKPDFTLFFKPEEEFQTLDIEIYSFRCASFIGNLQVPSSSLQLGEWQEIKLQYEKPQYSVTINGESGSGAIAHHRQVYKYGEISIAGSFFRVKAQGKFSWSFHCDPRTDPRPTTHVSTWVLLTLLLILLGAIICYFARKSRIFSSAMSKEDQRPLHPTPRRFRFSLARAWNSRHPPPVEPYAFTGQSGDGRTPPPPEPLYEDVKDTVATGGVNHHPEACRDKQGKSSNRGSSYSDVNSAYGEL